MTNEGAPTFDLSERTASFGEAVIKFALTIRRNAVTGPLLSQLVRAATSVGLNYCEADEAGSRKEFKYRISICKRESRETKLALRFVVKASQDDKAQSNARPLWSEAHELNRIFAAIHRNTKDD